MDQVKFVEHSFLKTFTWTIREYLDPHNVVQFEIIPPNCIGTFSLRNFWKVFILFMFLICPTKQKNLVKHFSTSIREVAVSFSRLIFLWQ